MWVLTPYGFFSIVQKPDDASRGTLTVRARVRSDLDALRAAVLPELEPTEEGKATDYRFRARAPRAAVADAMAKLAETLDYSNFKNAVAKRQGSKREKLYHDVWDVLYRMQGNPAYEVPMEKVAKASPPGKLNIVVPKADAYGGVLIDAQGRVLLREPKGHYGDYVWTFAKGRPDKDETPEQAALREVLEETGYRARTLAALPKVFGGTTSTTAFFLMEPLGKQGEFTSETIQTRWVSFDEAPDLIAQTKTATGRKRDLAVLEAARLQFAKLRSQVS